MSTPAQQTQWILGQPSYTLASNLVHVHITATAGHLAPAWFRHGNRTLAPLSIAPWWPEQHPDLPPILRILRGDFFCLPFGGGSLNGESHPIHGDTANLPWNALSSTSRDGVHELTLAMQTTTRPGRVEKLIRLIDHHLAIYQQHTIQGMAGPMPLGHHVMLQFPPDASAHISTSPTRGAQVWLEPGEIPALRGYSALKPGAIFDDLTRVPTADGSTTDLSRYPARDGFEDLVLLPTADGIQLAFSAAVVPSAGYIWLNLRSTRHLASTLLWHSNGGRHYAPWNGRHRGVLGLEDLTSYFAAGLAPSITDNHLNRAGIPTAVNLSTSTPTVIRYASLCIPCPEHFTHVHRVEPDDAGSSITIIDTAGQTTTAQADIAWLLG